jgi:hypothetical protein
MVVKVRDTIFPLSPQFWFTVLHRKASLSTHSKGTKSVYRRKNPKSSLQDNNVRCLCLIPPASKPQPNSRLGNKNSQYSPSPAQHCEGRVCAFSAALKSCLIKRELYFNYPQIHRSYFSHEIPLKDPNPTVDTIISYSRGDIFRVQCFANHSVPLQRNRG